MDSEQKKDYTMRISQANRSELVVIVYELFMYSLDTSEEYFKKDNIDEAVRYLKKSQECICELRKSLDFKYDISRNLEELYGYVHRQIVSSITRRESVNYDEIKKVMGSLKEAFTKVAEQDNSAPVMQNTQQIYAGLTYGKGKLNEVFMNNNETSRGFMA